METLEKPHCLKNVYPENPSVKDVHHDFANISEYQKKENLFPKNISEEIDHLEMKYGKKILLHHQLHTLLKFWNLKLCSTDKYVDEVPYYNQMEIHDFVKEHNIDPNKLSLVATSDTILDRQEMMKELHELQKSMYEKMIKFEEDTRSIRDEWNQIQLKKDPIVLLEVQTENFGLAYVIVSAWGAEEKALWNLPSIN